MGEADARGADSSDGAAGTGRTRIGAYALVERIAPAGGQGAVFRGVDPAGGRVSVKRIEPGAPGAHRIEEVHAALTRRRHPALGRQREVVRVDGDAALYVVADWVDGDTLARRARDATVPALLDWVRQVAEALDVLHADLPPDGPLLHRDIKPSNVVITPDGDAVLIDPGLARHGPSLATGSPYGTPGFVPPECIADPTAGSPAADRWQLAATLVDALLGEPPGWRSEPDGLRAALVDRCRGEVARPHELAGAVLAMLATDPASRPDSAGRWVAALHTAAGGPGAAAPGRRRLAVLGGTLAAAALLATAGVVGAAVGRAGGAGTADAAEAADPADGAVRGGGSAGASGDAAPSAGPGFTRRALVDTRTTSGTAIDDQHVAYLSTEPLDRCRAFGCEVPDATVATGDEVTLTCLMNGQRVTNGNDRSPVDDRNPLLYESERWYGVMLDDGTSGLLSEVWVHPDDRGGQGLPLC